MFRRISVFSKKIAVAAAIALAMTSLSACGDSGKKDSVSERTTHTISNINTDSTTELSTAATNDTSDDKTTASEQSSDTVTEVTTEKNSDDVVIAATQRLADKMMADTIRVAVEVALANEDAFTDVDNALKAAPKDVFITAKDKDGNDKQYLIVASISKDGVFEMRNGVPADGAFNTEIKLSITKVIVKFIAYGADRFTVAVDEEYRPAVFIGTADNEIKWQMTPETDPEYQ